MTSVRYFVSLIKNNYLLSILVFVLFFSTFFIGIMSIVGLAFISGDNKDDTLVSNAFNILGSKELVGSILLFIFCPILIWKLFKKEIDNSSIYIPLSYKMSRTTASNTKFLAAISLYIFPFLIINLIKDITTLAISSDSSLEIFGRLFLDGVNYIFMIVAWFSIVWFVFIVIPNTNLSIFLVVVIEVLFVSCELIPLFIKSDSDNKIWNYLTITSLFETSIVSNNNQLTCPPLSILIKDIFSILIITLFLGLSNFHWFKKMDINL